MIQIENTFFTSVATINVVNYTLVSIDEFIFLLCSIDGSGQELVYVTELIYVLCTQSHVLENLTKRQNRFQNQYVEIPRRPIIVCFLSLLAKPGLNPLPLEIRAGIFKESMVARNRGGIRLSYRPARLHRLAEFIP
jgi:hypothetical protein